MKTLMALAALVVWATPAMAQMAMSHTHVLVRAEQLEYGFDDAENPLAWDVMAWAGGDWNRLVLLSEGDVSTTGGGGEGELTALYGRLIGAFWELRVGARGDLASAGDTSTQRYHLALGVEGLVPYQFEFAPTLYVSHEGDVSARVHFSHELLITQRLVSQGSVEVNAAAQAVEDFGVGQGLNDVQLGWRLRYEISRKFAPYVGVEWTRRLFDTADLAEDPAQLLVLGGVRAWL